MQLRYEFHQLKMEDDTDDPDDWITKLEIIHRKLTKMGVKTSEDDVILQVLQNLPKQYETVVALSENEMTHGL